MAFVINLMKLFLAYTAVVQNYMILVILIQLLFTIS
jgi:hypothetical protein